MFGPKIGSTRWIAAFKDKLLGRGRRGRDSMGSINNIQYKSDWNCHYESPLNNEYIPIKNLYKNIFIFINCDLHYIP
jgi:hypothetical protein